MARTLTRPFEELGGVSSTSGGTTASTVAGPCESLGAFVARAGLDVEIFWIFRSPSRTIVPLPGKIVNEAKRRDTMERSR